MCECGLFPRHSEQVRSSESPAVVLPEPLRTLCLDCIWQAVQAYYGEGMTEQSSHLYQKRSSQDWFATVFVKRLYEWVACAADRCTSWTLFTVSLYFATLITLFHL